MAGGLYLHIEAQGKYWRMAYRIHGKQKTLYIGIYPTLSLVQASASAAQHTFEAVALAWLKATAHKRTQQADITQALANWHDWQHRRKPT